MTIAIVLAAPAVASAAPSAADAKLAEGLFLSGKEAMAKGDLVSACARFTESHKLDPAVGTLLNLATCEERSGKLVVALEHFTRARSQLAKEDFRVAFADERVEALSRRVGRVTLKFRTPRPPDGHVLRDGVLLEDKELAEPLLIDPGVVTITYEVPNVEPERVQIELAEGEQKLVELGPPPQPAEALPPAHDDAPATAAPRIATPTPRAHAARRTFAWVTGGLAIAGLTTGAVAGIMTINAASTYKDHCNAGECDDTGLEAASTGRTVRVVSPVGFAVGAAFGALSAYLFLTSRASSPRAIIAPAVVREGAGLSIVSTF